MIAQHSAGKTEQDQIGMPAALQQSRFAVTPGHHADFKQTAFQRAVEQGSFAAGLEADQLRQAQVGRKEKAAVTLDSRPRDKKAPRLVNEVRMVSARGI